jgi:ADP-ribose pyrophosphatase YjhB (NUDIX family)
MNLFNIGIFAIIFDKKDRVLLCHRRDYDLWNLPGGGLEKGESPRQGVIREVKEETGLIVETERLSGVYYKPENNEIIFSFVCKIIDGEITLTDEADQINYLDINDFPQNVSPKQKERAEDALLKKEKSVLKIQKGPSSIKLFNLEKKD